MPVVADRNLDIAARSTAYGWLYACFGLGAMLGALSVGTVFAQVAKETLVRAGMVAFGVSLAVFSWLRAPAPAFLLIVVVGFFYFADRHGPVHRAPAAPRRQRARAGSWRCG